MTRKARVACDKTELDPGESMNCTDKTGTATAGLYTNEAKVTTVEGPEDTDPSNYTGKTLSIEVEKSTNGQDADSAPGPSIPEGGDVTWSYVVTNTGETKLTGIAVVDDQEGAVACDKTELDPGESMNCTDKTGTATAGLYTNEAKVTTVEGPEDTDPSNYTGKTLSIEVEKSTNGQDADSAPGPSIPEGGDVTWSYVGNQYG